MSLSAEPRHSLEGGQVAKVVADDHHRTRPGLGDDPPDRVALVGVDARGELPDELARDHLEPVPLGNLPDRLIDWAGPPVRIIGPTGVNGDGVLLVLEVSAAGADGRTVAQLLVRG